MVVVFVWLMARVSSVLERRFNDSVSISIATSC
jgi:hypothetical protein